MYGYLGFAHCLCNTPINRYEYWVSVANYASKMCVNCKLMYLFDDMLVESFASDMQLQLM